MKERDVVNKKRDVAHGVQNVLRISTEMNNVAKLLKKKEGRMTDNPGAGNAQGGSSNDSAGIKIIKPVFEFGEKPKTIRFRNIGARKFSGFPAIPETESCKK
eukprot:scaffold421226_cov55-Attheya_sp.AAC.3